MNPVWKINDLFFLIILQKLFVTEIAEISYRQYFQIVWSTTVMASLIDTRQMLESNIPGSVAIMDIDR